MNHPTNKLQPKNKIKAKSEQLQQQTTRKRRSVVRQETPSPRATVSKEKHTHIFATVKEHHT